MTTDHIARELLEAAKEINYWLGPDLFDSFDVNAQRAARAKRLLDELIPRAEKELQP
jgi:hypothetical protein